MHKTVVQASGARWSGLAARTCEAKQGREAEQRQCRAEREWRQLAELEENLEAILYSLYSMQCPLFINLVKSIYKLLLLVAPKLALENKSMCPSKEQGPKKTLIISMLWPPAPCAEHLLMLASVSSVWSSFDLHCK